jgi:hypothetical protein
MCEGLVTTLMMMMMMMMMIMMMMMMMMMTGFEELRGSSCSVIPWFLFFSHLGLEEAEQWAHEAAA